MVGDEVRDRGVTFVVVFDGRQPLIADRETRAEGTPDTKAKSRAATARSDRKRGQDVGQHHRRRADRAKRELAEQDED